MKPQPIAIRIVTLIVILTALIQTLPVKNLTMRYHRVSPAGRVMVLRNVMKSALGRLPHGRRPEKWPRIAVPKRLTSTG